MLKRVKKGEGKLEEDGKSRKGDRGLTNRQTHSIEMRSCVKKRINQAQMTKIGISMYFLFRATGGHTDGHIEGQTD